jgi:hypothetical protein
MHSAMTRQIGLFFLYIGIIITIIAVTSFQIEDPVYGALMLGIGISIFGIFLAWRYRPAPSESERFKAWKKMTSKKK